VSANCYYIIFFRFTIEISPKFPEKHPEFSLKFHRYRAHVSCCVLSSGGIYTFGRYFSLRKQTEPLFAFEYHVMYMRLKKKSIRGHTVNLLTVKIRSSITFHTLEVMMSSCVTRNFTSCRLTCTDSDTGVGSAEQFRVGQKIWGGVH
jgi:hypothetical protein